MADRVIVSGEQETIVVTDQTTDIIYVSTGEGGELAIVSGGQGTVVSTQPTVEVVYQVGTGPQGPPGDAGDLNARGVWDSGSTYSEDDLVSWSGVSWLATGDILAGEEPGVVATWVEFISVGDIDGGVLI
jgi:hypothetical protein